MRFRFMAGAALAAFTLSGCAVVSDLGATGLAESIEDSAATLNIAHTRAMTSIIALNVLRARDRWPTNYTTLSGIRSNPTMQLNGSANFGPLGLGNAPLPFAGSSANISRNESANAEYSVNPFSNNDKTQGLLKPIQPDQMKSYWQAGWPRETLMWLFVDAVNFNGDAHPWRIDGDEFAADASTADTAFATRYLALIDRAKKDEVTFDLLPAADLDRRGCSPYDPVYLRDTLGGQADTMKDTIATVEALSGKRMILAPDTRQARPGEAAVAADRFNRRLMLCDPREAYWGFIEVATGKVEATVTMRSFDDMIYFLGETLRSGGASGASNIGGVTLFRTFEKRDGREFAVRVEHAGDVYFVAPQSGAGANEAKDLTGNVLSLLNQLYLLAQSDEFMRAPESKIR